MNYKNSLKNAKNLADIFHLVKCVVKNHLGIDQAGLLLGLSDLSLYENSYLGAFYSFDANTIVINKRPLNNIMQTSPRLYNPYIFHVLLHEYIHSLGVVEEPHVKQLVYEVTEKYFGKNHLATQMAFDLERFIPNLTFETNFEPAGDLSIEFVSGIDRDNTNYIM